jgi:AcrR family transcriptional regulator
MKKAPTTSGRVRSADPLPSAAIDAAGGPAGLERSGRLRLIEAAEVEFCQKGFEGASVLAIARRAGVKQPLLNYHFGSKEGLWRSVVENAYAEAATYHERAAGAVGAADPLSRLQALLRAFTVLNILHPAAHSLVFREVAQAGPRLDWLVENYMRPFHLALDGLIAECTAAGLLKPYPVEHASIMMTGMLTALQAATHLVTRIYGTQPMTEAQAEKHAEQAIDALLNGMRAR